MEHLHIFQAGHKLGWEQIRAADELVIHIPGSKTDIYNDGYKLNIKLRAGDTPSDINPLCLLRQLYTMNPARFGAILQAELLHLQVQQAASPPAFGDSG